MEMQCKSRAGRGRRCLQRGGSGAGSAFCGRGKRQKEEVEALRVWDWLRQHGTEIPAPKHPQPEETRKTENARGRRCRAGRWWLRGCCPAPAHRISQRGQRLPVPTGMLQVHGQSRALCFPMVCPGTLQNLTFWCFFESHLPGLFPDTSYGICTSIPAASAARWCSAMRPGRLRSPNTRPGAAGKHSTDRHTVGTAWLGWAGRGGVWVWGEFGFALEKLPQSPGG